MEKEKCCGMCCYHRKVLYGLYSEWQCTNPDSERYGRECEFHDTCALFDGDGVHLGAPIMKKPLF